VSIKKQYSKQSDATSFNVNINTVGGEVTEGRKMFAFLEGLKEQGIEITTVTDGLVASMGTYLFMVGNERIYYDSDEFRPHLPFAKNFSGNSVDLLQAGLYVDSKEKEFAKFYAEHTNLEYQESFDLLAEDRVITNEEMLSMGFATQIREKRQIFATIKIENMGLIDEAKKVLGLSKEETVIEKTAEVVNVLITLEDGTQVETSAEVSTPAIGDAWNVEGIVIANGNYKTQSGFDVVIESGKVSASVESTEEVIEVVENKAQVEIDAMKIEIANLSASFETFKSENETKLASKDEELVTINATLTETSELLEKSIERVTSLSANASVNFDDSKPEVKEDFTISRVRK
jgi:ATP-dependent protease ClpP protease subunit